MRKIAFALAGVAYLAAPAAYACSIDDFSFVRTDIRHDGERVTVEGEIRNECATLDVPLAQFTFRNDAGEIVDLYQGYPASALPIPGGMKVHFRMSFTAKEGWSAVSAKIIRVGRP